jgi:hypothetical protein
MEILITPEEIRLQGMFDEDILTDTLLNSMEFIPLAQNEALGVLTNKGIDYNSLTNTQKDFFKLAVVENTRAKCCSYMSVYILNEAKKVDKADIKYEKYATVSNWKEQAQIHAMKYNDYLSNSIGASQSGGGIAPSMLVEWSW